MNADFGPGDTLVDGGVAFGYNGKYDYMAGAAVYNKVRSTFFMTATASSVTFSAKCFHKDLSAQAELEGPLNDFVVELVPAN